MNEPNERKYNLPPGLGSVYFRKDVGRWTALGPPDANGKRKSGGTFDDPDAATMWLIGHYKGSAPVDVEPQPTRGDVLFRDAIKKWSDGRPVKESTRSGDKGLLRHIKGHNLGARPMGKLRPEHVTQILRELPFNSRKYQFGRRLSTFFGWAEVNGYTLTHLYRRSDASKIVSDTKKRSEEWRRPSTDVVWSAEEIATFIETERNPQYQLTWAIFAVTACRCGEALGLQWLNQHLDDECPWGWAKMNITTSEGSPILEETPKAGERRKLYYGKPFAAYLLTVQAEQAAYRATLPCWDEDGWILDRRTNSRQTMGRWGMFLSPGTVQGAFVRHATRLGLEHAGGPHVIRKSISTIANAEGYDKSLRIDLLGHKPDVTDGYVKTPPAERHRFAEHMSKLLLPSFMLPQ